MAAEKIKSKRFKIALNLMIGQKISLKAAGGRENTGFLRRAVFTQMGSKLIKAIMVDVDGVLVHGRPSDGRPWASDIEADLGINSMELHREFFALYWDDIVTGRQSLAEPLQRALAVIAPDVSPEKLMAYWFENDARLNLPLLAELDQQRRAGIKVYLATNQEHRRASYLINQLGLGEHCDGIYYSAALACRKPDIDFYLKATCLAKVPAEQLLLIDDTPANVLAAQNAGWNAVEWTMESSLAAVLATLQS